MPKKHKWSLVRSSTRSFFAEAKSLPNYSFLDFLHGYIYGRWPYLYINIAKGDHPLARFLSPVISFLERILLRHGGHDRHPIGSEKEFGKEKSDVKDNNRAFADTYHGKVVPLEAAKRLVTVDRNITITNLEKVIPYAQARDIVLKNPDHIVVLQCPCRSSRSNPCQPVDVCLVIGEPFAGFISEHHPQRSRWITPTEAVDILREEDDRGHVHHAFFKDAMLGRFYAICNCCFCCCGAMQAHQHGVPMLASSGYVAEVDRNKCKGCAKCSKFCQFGAINVVDGLKTIDYAKCMGCGACLTKCSNGAISLVRDQRKGEPLEIHKLMEEVLIQA